ncbi:MAG: hypothetical protein QM756_24855 [Polyangiaceae bacterium]
MKAILRRSFLLLSLPCALWLTACEESGPRVYTARLFHPADAGAACLDAYTPIGLVEAGDLGASCDAVCLWQGDELYVSTVCPPLPATFEREDPVASSECQAALALLADEEAKSCGE